MLVIGIIFLFIGVSIIPTINGNIKTIDKAVYEEVIKDRITILKQIEPVGTHEDYINSRQDKPYFIIRISEPPKKTTSPLLIVFVESDLVSELTDEIILYNETLRIIGYDSIIYEASGVTPEDLKDIILTYWQNGYNLTGTVLIGDFPVAWFHHSNDFYGLEEFPCDLFLMDLDGTWIDTNHDNKYDSHTDGSGDTAPEIYIGRIDASNIPGDEIPTLKKYFAKVYDFWSGTTNQTKYGLTYTDKDWAYFEYFRYDLGYAYEDYEAIWYPDVDRDDYLNNRTPSTYEFIQLSCHSSSQRHSFAIGGNANNYDIRYSPPRALFYNLFCCSSLRFTDYNCIGYAYILNTNTPSLSVVGSAKTGSMLDFRYFYEPIGNGDSFGTAFRKWFEYEYPYSDDPGGYNDISWFYGMTILGDPTIIINNKPPVKPVKPSGPLNGLKGESYTYSSSTTDPDGNQIYYNFSWGDNTYSGWVGPYDSGQTVNLSHIWNVGGTYEIKVQARDFSGKLSDWSEPLSIIIDNSPEIPIIKGPIFGKVGISYPYKFIAIDPDGDNICYFIDWGDGSEEITNYSPSGDEEIRNHTWNESGTYTIRAKAVDEYGAESGWGELQVVIPRTRTTNVWYNWFVKRFPLLERLLTMIKFV
jgi:hypothetical protein